MVAIVICCGHGKEIPMLRRSLALAAASLATMALVIGIAPITSSSVVAKERDEYGRLFLKDVTGDAAIIKYYDKKFGLKFKDGFVYINNLKCWPYGRCFVEGKISGDIYDHYWKFILKVYPADFKAPAWLYKEDDDHYGPYAAASDYPYKPRPPRPPKDECKLSLDIGKIKLVQYDYSSKYKKYPTIIFIDPDPADLYVKDRYYKKQLCDLAKPSYGDEEPPKDPYVEVK